jgi:hypothetical protein
MPPLSYARARECFSPLWPNLVRRPSVRAFHLLTAPFASPIPRHPPRDWQWGRIPDDPDDRIRLAHAVLVGVAGFDAFRNAVGAPLYDAARFSLWEQATLLRASIWSGSGTAENCAGLLLETELPCPGPTRSYRDTLEDLHPFFDVLAKNCIAFVSGLALPTGPRFALPLFLPLMPENAVRRYNALVRRLGAEVPEFSGWLSMNEMVTGHRPAVPAARRSPTGPVTAVTRQRPADVHLIFADDLREYVESVAETLMEAGVRTRLYAAPSPYLQGARLVDRLRAMYGGATRFSVLFLSPGYSRQVWQGHARLQAHSTGLAEFGDRLLLVRTDATSRLPFPSEPHWFADARLADPQVMAALVREELA